MERDDDDIPWHYHPEELEERARRKSEARSLDAVDALRAVAPMRRKVPMDYAALVLAEICDKIDDSNANQIDAFLEEAFDDAMADLSDCADRRIAFDRWVKAQQAAAEETIEWAKDRLGLLKEVQRRFREKTQAIIEAKPDLPYAGKLGKISLVTNQPAVEYAFGSKALSCPEEAEHFGVSKDYLIEKKTYEIDAGRVKAELMLGAKLPWAKFVYGQHIRFPQQRKPKKKQPEIEE